ncbi:MAG: asparagine synthase (glutamine-hydrolyzing) [Cytophagaceae bacterium]
MCGIAGYINSTLTRNEFTKALNCLSHRGPDSDGYFFDEIVGLGHKRLSIIDLSPAGSQPYRFENLVLVFNGELYNYKEVRDILIQDGYTFTSGSDTEVLIKAFHKWREKAVDRFIGMFAFAVYDQQSGEMYLFRDRVGVKPLYYSLSNGLIFGSELKVFKKIQISLSIDRDAVYQYFRFGYITNDNSIFSEVKKLLPGHYLKYKNGESDIRQYWNPEIKRSPGLNEGIVEEQLEELLTSCFRYRMVSDVPVGVFLSGGIDSSLVASILQKSYGNVNTFTIGFDQLAFNEAPYAKKVAEHLGTNHHEKILNGKSAKDLLYNFYDIYDEPFSDSSGIPTALVSSIAKANGVKVVLSADGGDELFCGYTHYQKIQKYIGRFYAPHSRKNKIQDYLINKLHASGIFRNFFPLNLEHKLLTYQDLILSKDIVGFYENYISNQAEKELETLTGKGTFKSSRYEYHGQGNASEQMMYWDLLHYLPDDLLVKVDRATMYHSIEGREPFLDHRLIEYSLGLPFEYKFREGKNKYILKKILSRHIPEELFERPKKGFSIPIFQWFSNDLFVLFQEYLSREKLNATGIFNTGEVLREYEKFKFYKARKKEYNIEKMWRILSFMMWWEKWNKE